MLWSTWAFKMTLDELYDTGHLILAIAPCTRRNLDLDKWSITTLTIFYPSQRRTWASYNSEGSHRSFSTYLMFAFVLQKEIWKYVSPHFDLRVLSQGDLHGMQNLQQGDQCTMIQITSWSKLLQIYSYYRFDVIWWLGEIYPITRVWFSLILLSLSSIWTFAIDSLSYSGDKTDSDEGCWQPPFFLARRNVLSFLYMFYLATTENITADSGQSFQRPETWNMLWTGIWLIT